MRFLAFLFLVAGAGFILVTSLANTLGYQVEFIEKAPKKGWTMTDADGHALSEVIEADTEGEVAYLGKKDGIDRIRVRTKRADGTIAEQIYEVR